jgi:hypothetical protein
MHRYTGFWYYPEHEIIDNGRLIEAGELFRLYPRHPNDRLIVRSGQVLTSRLRKTSTYSCIACGKWFEGRNYLELHEMNGCGRTRKEQVLYGDMREEPELYGRQLYLLFGYRWNTLELA